MALSEKKSPVAESETFYEMLWDCPQCAAVSALHSFTRFNWM
jgi:hypothetical protein